jgi:hypothetical protein
MNKERIHGPSKKIKTLSYGRFKVLEKVVDKSYILSLPPYMHIYLVVNVDNLKLYEPSMLDQEEDHTLPTIEDSTPDAQGELVEDTILQKNSKNGHHDLWKIGLKGQFIGKSKWYSRKKVEENFPHPIQ